MNKLEICNALTNRDEPSKVIYLSKQSTVTLAWCRCPNCKEKMLEPINPLSKQFCGFCGQKLDWRK